MPWKCNMLEVTWSRMPTNLTDSFFQNRLRTLENAYVRPRFIWLAPFSGVTFGNKALHGQSKYNTDPN